jgi:hypothetical protein
MCLIVRASLVLIIDYGRRCVVMLEKSGKKVWRKARELHRQMRLPPKLITCLGVPAILAPASAGRTYLHRHLKDLVAVMSTLEHTSSPCV